MLRAVAVIVSAAAEACASLLASLKAASIKDKLLRPLKAPSSRPLPSRAETARIAVS